MIEKLCRKGSSVSLIADLLGFHRPSIYREFKQGRVTPLNSELVEFDTYSADRASDEAHPRASSHGSSLKMADDFTLVNDFNKLIIHHRLSLYGTRQVLIWRGVDVRVSLRTLYNSVHRLGFPILPDNLIHRPRKHAKNLLLKRLAHNNVLAQSIEKRPLQINDRSDFGHHEMDTVVDPPGSSHVLLVLTKRKTRIEHILLMKDKSQNSIRLALNPLMPQVFVNPAETRDCEQTCSMLTLTVPPSVVVMRTPTDSSDASCPKELIPQHSLKEF